MLTRIVKRLSGQLGLQISRTRETLVVPRPRPGPETLDCTGIDWNTHPLDARLDSRIAALAPFVDELLTSIRDGESPYRPDNSFFGLADAAIAYAQIRRHRPETVVEVGSGFSSYVLRQALDRNDHGRLVSIDPQPRIEIAEVVDESIRARVESIAGAEIAERVGDGVLFIDSSHVVATGNDVTHLYLETLPRLAAGALVHVHDVYLPDDYPTSWNIDRGFNYSEQYLLQAFLSFNRDFDVTWPGRYILKRHRDRLAGLLGSEARLDAHCSFWFRRATAESPAAASLAS